ncbi:MAG: DUF5106 domain-containing protein [Bacteroidales bacterium]|nr:DUF5106 domain-containing protein [Bacteroidales bacterium]
MNKILLVLLALVLTLPVQAKKKNNYDLTVKINHGRDTMLLLGHYYGKGNRVIDTAYLDKKGLFHFSSDKQKLPEGLCFFANARGNYVEFVVYGEKPFFHFETNEKDWTAHMTTKGSAQNELFFNFHRQQSAIIHQIDSLSTRMDSAAFVTYRNSQYRRLDSLRLNIIETHPESFLSIMMTCTKDVYPPEYDSQGNKLTDRQRREYYLDHYFDNIPLENNAIIYTPEKVFSDRVMNYFDNILKYASPEVIISHIDPLLQRAKNSPNIFQYLVINLTQKYLQSNIMVYDQIYVHMVKNYFASDLNFWSSPSSIEKESMRAAKWERLLIGKEAPELVLYDTLRVPHSLHAMPSKWKLLVFWSPSCGHCKHVIPTVYEVFEKYRDQYDIAAFTILSEPDDKTRQEWKEFLKKHNMNHPAWLSLDGGEANVDWHDVYDITSTPQIYLIDENNIIQAKKLGEGNIEDIIKGICGEGL